MSVSAADTSSEARLHGLVGPAGSRRTLEMTLAGERVQSTAVAELAARLDPAEPLAVKLRRAVEDQHVMVALTPDDRARLLEALESPPSGLGGLRARLLEQARDRT